MSDLRTSWSYPLTEVRENRASRKAGSGMNPGEAYELVGVDATIMGGVRPFYGFRLVHKLCDGSCTVKSGQPAADAVSTSAKITDVFGVSFKVSQHYGGHGFVYRTFDSGTVTIGIEYRISSSPTVWRYQRLRTYSGTQPLPQMDVTTWGRFVYVVVGGNPMTIFYVLVS